MIMDGQDDGAAIDVQLAAERWSDYLATISLDHLIHAKTAFGQPRQA